MGVVYISREMNEDRFTIGAAKSFAMRKRGGYTRYNPRLKTYRILQTPDHFSLEKFLHAELAERRILDIQSESWYTATSEEVDVAIERAEIVGREHIARKKKVTELKNVQTNGRWLEPTQRLRDICDRLSIVLREKNALRNEEERLRVEAMVYIGDADGVEGLFQWASESQRRFQTKIFARNHPELYEAFRAEKFVRKFKLWGREECDEDATQEE
jgi:T5orf172 domain